MRLEVAVIHEVSRDGNPINVALVDHNVANNEMPIVCARHEVDP